MARRWRVRRHGQLQGRNKDEIRKVIGERQVWLWRRSYSAKPPPLNESDERFPGHERKYADVPPDQIPRGESLQDTVARVLPYWHSQIEPLVIKGQVPLVVAHGNSLRGIVKHLDGVSDDDISALEIPTGRPLVYDLDDDLKAIQRRYLTAKV